MNCETKKEDSLNTVSSHMRESLSSVSGEGVYSSRLVRVWWMTL